MAGTSRPEIGLRHELSVVLGHTHDQNFRVKLASGGTVFTDIYFPKLKVVIEYDGNFWHRSKNTRDREINSILKGQGLEVVRVREALPRIGKHDVVVEIGAEAKHVAEEVLRSLVRLGLATKTQLNGYVDHSGLVAAEAAEAEVAARLTRTYPKRDKRVRGQRLLCSRCQDNPAPNRSGRAGICLVCAADMAQLAGFEPLEEYSGRRGDLWRLKCHCHGIEHSLKWTNLYPETGNSPRQACRVCPHCSIRLSYQSPGPPGPCEPCANRILCDVGIEPKTDYPGGVGRPWHGNCASCGADVQPRLLNIIHRGGWTCRNCSNK